MWAGAGPRDPHGRLIQAGGRERTVRGDPNVSFSDSWIRVAEEAHTEDTVSSPVLFERNATAAKDGPHWWPSAPRADPLFSVT